MSHPETNRFQDFFEERKYTVLKNYLYNYLLRKIAVEKSLLNERSELILEVGSGISPMMTPANRITYLDLSFAALQILKDSYGKGWYVVADCMSLPFKSSIFSHTISSEVLEHLPDDRKAINELARVLKPSGRFIVTFPHRKFYFAIDDRFVNHFRRYELHEMMDRLKAAGFRPIFIQKVLGPLEKLTMCFVVFCFSMMQNIKLENELKSRNLKLVNILSSIFMWLNRCYMVLARLDAMIMPRAVSTVLLIKSILSEKPNAK